MDEPMWTKSSTAMQDPYRAIPSTVMVLAQRANCLKASELPI
jgi:hypothetical protein